jgi:uncharacterized protein (UPF0332 family)
VKPGTADYLAKGVECLDAAKKINAFPLPQVAAKEAYLAAFHAAHAWIFESTGKVVKSHVGMRTMFALVSKDDPRIDRTLASLLRRAYKYKESSGLFGRVAGRCHDRGSAGRHRYRATIRGHDHRTDAAGHGERRMIGALANVERSSIVERTRVGASDAQKHDAEFGRGTKLTPDRLIHARKLVEQGRHPLRPRKSLR